MKRFWLLLVIFVSLILLSHIIYGFINGFGEIATWPRFYAPSWCDIIIVQICLLTIRWLIKVKRESKIALSYDKSTTIEFELIFGIAWGILIGIAIVGANNGHNPIHQFFAFINTNPNDCLITTRLILGLPVGISFFVLIIVGVVMIFGLIGSFMAPLFEGMPEAWGFGFVSFISSFGLASTVYNALVQCFY